MHLTHTASSQSISQVLNKIDAISIEELDLLYRIPHSVPISSREWWNIDEKNVTSVDLVTQSINDLEEIPDDEPESFGEVTSTIIDT